MFRSWGCLMVGREGKRHFQASSSLFRHPFPFVTVTSTTETEQMSPIILPLDIYHLIKFYLPSSDLLTHTNLYNTSLQLRKEVSPSSLPPFLSSFLSSHQKLTSSFTESVSSTQRINPGNLFSKLQVSRFRTMISTAPGRTTGDHHGELSFLRSFDMNDETVTLRL